VEAAAAQSMLEDQDPLDQGLLDQDQLDLDQLQAVVAQELILAHKGKVDTAITSFVSKRKGYLGIFELMPVVAIFILGIIPIKP